MARRASYKAEKRRKEVTRKKKQEKKRLRRLSKVVGTGQDVGSESTIGAPQDIEETPAGNKEEK